MYRQRMKSSDKQTDLQGDCVLKARSWIEPGRMQMQQGATRSWWFHCSDWGSFVNILVQRSQVFDNLLKCTVRETQMGLWNSEDWICPRYDHNPDQEFFLRSNCPFRSWSPELAHAHYNGRWRVNITGSHNVHLVSFQNKLVFRLKFRSKIRG